MAKNKNTQAVKLKRGDRHPSGDLVFWSYNPGCKNGEYWMTPEKFVERMEWARLYEKQNVEAHRIAKKKYLLKHQERLKIVNKQRNQKYRIYRLNWYKERLIKDPVFKLSTRVRARIREALKDRRLIKTKTSLETVGCGWGELRDHLESLFCDDMSWDNMELWHIDHIVPLASAKTEEDVIKLCHFTNLQPLWATDNLKKGKRIQG
jgi:hypothetical protein